MVSQLMTVYGRKSSTEEYDHLSHIWEKALAKLNEQEIRVGYQNLMKTRVKSGMPSPAEFFEALYNDISDDALMAWNQLFQALKSHPGRPICFEDTVLAETCRRLGGLPFLGSLSATDLSFQKRSFMIHTVSWLSRGIYSILFVRVHMRRSLLKCSPWLIENLSLEVHYEWSRE